MCAQQSYRTMTVRISLNTQRTGCYATQAAALVLTSAAQLVGCNVTGEGRAAPWQSACTRMLPLLWPLCTSAPQHVRAPADAAVATVLEYWCAVHSLIHSAFGYTVQCASCTTHTTDRGCCAHAANRLLRSRCYAPGRLTRVIYLHAVHTPLCVWAASSAAPPGSSS